MNGTRGAKPESVKKLRFDVRLGSNGLDQWAVKWIALASASTVWNVIDPSGMRLSISPPVCSSTQRLIARRDGSGW